MMLRHIMWYTERTNAGLGRTGPLRQTASVDIIKTMGLHLLTSSNSLSNSFTSLISSAGLTPSRKIDDEVLNNFRPFPNVTLDT